MAGPLDSPDENWWDHPLNRRETIWLGIAGAWSLGIFAWMAGFTQFGDQNPVGDTYEVDPVEYANRVDDYWADADRTDEGYYIPPDDSVYLLATRFNWEPLSSAPVVLETDVEYDIHLGALDVQHGFSVRPEGSLSQQINLQVFPDREWIIPMTFETPDTYHVICNEFCGEFHAGMQDEFIVRED